MKKFTITLEYKGMPIKADTAEEAEWRFNELFEIYGKDVWNDCDIIATEIQDDGELIKKS
jgi:AAA+ superfamily predicted ATPase